nr:MAG TPA: hypothetical protein [Caudoviricetes sp.]
MEIVKKIARYILRKELKLQEVAFETQAGLIHDYSQRFEEFEIQIESLRKIAFGSRKVLLSQIMVQTIVEMLPDPNKAGTGSLTSSELSMRSRCFVDRLNGREFQHKIKFVKAIGEGSIQGLTVHISDYNITVTIPLRRENVNYEVYGVQTAIDTYFWDFYGAGIRMLSNEAFAISSEFIKAQHNVLSEFREQGLL